MGWVGHVAHMNQIEICTTFWVENLKGRVSLIDLGVDVWMILRWFLQTLYNILG
jgi:hypothetical protein